MYFSSFTYLYKLILNIVFERLLTRFKRVIHKAEEQFFEFISSTITTYIKCTSYMYTCNQYIAQSSKKNIANTFAKNKRFI